MRTLFSSLFFILLYITCGAVLAQPVNTLIDIGEGNAIAMSNSGTVVIGEGEWYWTYSTGKVELDPDETYSTNDVNDDTVIVGNFRDPNAITPDGDTSAVAGYWKDGIWTALGQAPGVPYFDFDQDEYNRAWGISRNGQYIAGHQKYSSGNYEAFKWDSVTGYTMLGYRFHGSRANAVSDDGSIVVGWDEMESGAREAVYWDPDPHYINPDKSGEANNVTPDGVWIVGITDGYGFRWSANTGLENLYPAGVSGGGAMAVSNDGSVIGGGVSSGFFYEAFVWTENDGFQYLEDYLASYGISTTGWNFYWVTGVSGDGKILSGYGLYALDSKLHSFWVKIESPSALDKATSPVTDFHLEQNYPNPFNPSTTISFNLPKSNQIELTIHDMQGRKVRTLLNQSLSAGLHQAKWDGMSDAGKKVAAGIYFYTLRSGDYQQTKKMILIP